MRGKVLVIGCLLLMGASLGVVANPLSGSISTWSQIEASKASPQTVALTAFEWIFEIDYATCNWTFGPTGRFTTDDTGSRFDFVFFDVAGEVGVLDAFSIAQFDPTPAAGQPFIDLWNSSARLSLGGVELYSILLLSSWTFYDQGDWHYINDVGTGLLLGGWGSVADCSVWTQVRFNVYESSHGLIRAFGYYWVLENLGLIKVCDFYGVNRWFWHNSGFLPQTPVCTLPWSGTNIIVETPLTCFDLVTEVEFTCDNGFRSVGFGLENIGLGLDWLQLAGLEIGFEVQTKSVDARFGLVVGDCVCFTPYLSVVTGRSNTVLDGIALDADCG